MISGDEYVHYGSKSEYDTIYNWTDTIVHIISSDFM